MNRHFIKITAFLLSVILLSFCVGCENTPENPEETDDISTTDPSGDDTTSVPIVDPIDQSQLISDFTSKYSFANIGSDYPDVDYVMMIDDQPVTFDEFYFYLRSTRKELANGDLSVYEEDPELAGIADEFALAQIKQNHAILSLGYDLGLGFSPSEKSAMDEYVNQYASDMGGVTILREGLAEYFESLWFFYYDNAIEKMSDSIQREIASKKGIDLDDVDTVVEFGLSDRCAAFSRIFLTDKSRAEDVYQKLQNGEDFDLLLEEYSEDDESGKKGFVACIDVLDNTIADALRTLKPGEYSGIVQTYYGYLILKRQILTKEMVETEENIEYLRSDYQTALVSDAILEKIAQQTVTYSENYEALYQKALTK